MPMDGTSLHFDHITTSSGSIHAANAVVGAGVEFTYGSFFSIDVTGRDIKYTASTAGIFNPGGFNGVIISDYLDVLPDFTAISIVVDGDGGAIDSSRYWVEAQEVHLNFEGLSLNGLNGITFRVVLGDVPTDIILSNDAVIEGVSGAIIGDLTTLDADQSSGHVYAVDDPRFEVVAGQLKLKDGTALDYGSSPTVLITVTTTDEWDNALEQTLTITVDQDIPPPPDNHHPVILSPRLQDAVEGDKAAFVVEAYDRDGDLLAYSISGGRDADAFVIDPATGELIFKDIPDFEWPGSAAGNNAYQVEVSVSDGKLTTTKTFEVNVNDVDEARTVGTLGDDQFSASGSSTHFIGLSGVDAVMFSGRASDYAIEQGPHGTIYVTGPEGTDTLSSIERLQFDDGTLAFDTDGDAGQMFRLYQAVFGREPDAEGLGYWVHHQDAGQSSFQDVARSFMASPEFEQRYGSEDKLSNSDFLDLLYQNVLGRDPDPDGFAYWADKLDTGQTNFGDLLAFFSDSNENIAGTADAVSDGIWFA